MDCAWVRADLGYARSRVEDGQTPAGSGQGGGSLMDYYTLAGLAAVAFVAGLVGLRVARDERMLRRKIPVE